MKIFQRTSITVNGQTYRSVEEMPPDVRQTYEQLMSRMRADVNQNGIPDVFEGKPGDGGTSVAQVTTSVQSFGGKLPAATGLTPVSPDVAERAMARAAEAMSMAALSESRRGGGGGSSGAGGMFLTWPTLIALLATAALIGAAVAWFVKTRP